MGKPVIAVQLYTLRDFCKTPGDLKQTLHRVKAMGYHAVQVSGIAPMDPQIVKDATEQEGLTVCATHISFDRLGSDLDGVIRQHKLWNCRYVGIGSMPDNYRESREGYIQFAKETSEYGRLLAQEGLTLIYHNHNFEFRSYGKVTGMELLYEESDPAALQFEIDTYWVQAGGADPIWWIRKLGGRMDVVHYKDMALNEQSQQIMAEVGEGNLNWKGILAACEETGVKWCAVEQDVCRRDPFEALKISKDNLAAMGCRF
ncbi:MAG: sugar phosphate isomerase/epimerase [Lachnospiraceae bacterium]|jgi:sugar phosphate isomerase/epimerase|nr:sugar phosphate isomerase/epimerase [Lachnospiraceae bacterium]